MERYQVILAYDGTDFLGFQRQAGAQGGRTVQAVVETGLRQLGWQGRALLAAGRTDAGVHASGQVIAFDLDWKHSPQALRDALNALLPADIAVRSVQAASQDFHPRYDASGRRYRYRLFCQETRDPLRERYAWRVWPPADLGRLQSVAAVLVGSHDFAAFGSPPRPGGSTIREVTQAGWQVEGQDWIFEIAATAFLYHMVRSLVYTLVAAGQGKLETETTIRRLETIPVTESSRQERVHGLAPPQGLVLVEVMYADRRPAFQPEKGRYRREENPDD